MGGLGFWYKWNLGWMHDTLDYMKLDPIYRQYHHDKLTFGMLYNYTENFVLPLSHDEVVHGKKSILDRMPGDAWQKFANLRAYYGWMWAFPGKKLLFMGNEFAQGREWNHDASLDWHLLEGGDNWHHGVQRLVRDLNHTYRHHKAMHELDFDPYGFEWLVVDDKERSVLIFVRRDKEGNEIIVASNFTPCRVMIIASVLTSRVNGVKSSIPIPCTITAVMQAMAAQYTAMRLPATVVSIH